MVAFRAPMSCKAGFVGEALEVSHHNWTLVAHVAARMLYRLQPYTYQAGTLLSKLAVSASGTKTS